MHVLLIDVLESTKPKLLLRVPFFDRDMERVLIELYYRGIAEGLVHNVLEDIDGRGYDNVIVLDIVDWLNSKLKNSLGIKELDLVNNLMAKLVLV